MTRVYTSRARPTASRSEALPSHFWLGLALVTLGLGAAAVAVLGPLVTGTIEYHVSDGAANQIVGGDVSGLALMVPLSLLAGIMVWRGHVAGPVLALAPALYGIYMYSQLALGGDVVRYEGNSERFFLLFLGLFILAAAIAIRAWTLVDANDLPATSRWVDRVFGIFSLVVAFFLAFGLHIPGLVDAWAEQPVSTEYLADPVVFWLVKFMDLGIVVPALVLVGTGLLLDRRWVDKAKYAAAGWMALLGSSIAGMAIVMQSTGDPAATAANTIAFSLFAVLALGLAIALYLPLFRARS